MTETRRRGNRNARRDDYKDRDMVDLGRVPSYLRDRIESERERIDPSTDSLGRKRQQRSLESLLESVLLAGLVELAKVPDWSDPLNLLGTLPDWVVPAAGDDEAPEGGDGS